MKEFFLGLDIGGTKCAVLLARARWGIEIMDKIRFETCPEKGFEYAYGKLCHGMEEILQRNGLSFAKVKAVGVSCGGPLDSRRGVVLCPPNLPGWVNIPLRDMLEERYDVPVFLQNDANACALVEWKLGAGRGCENMIFLTMGTGMGAGIIAEGKLLRGVSDMGGEVGHLRLAEDGPVGFGKAGSFEGFCSGGGIGRQATDYTRMLLESGKTPAWVMEGHSAKEMDAALMAAYARNGDAQAVEFWNGVGRRLGQALSLLTDVLNPGKIVIGSVFVRCEELLRPAMEAELEKETIPFSLDRLEVVPAQTGEAIGDLASIMVALYGLGVEPGNGDDGVASERVMGHFQSLMERYPALEACREDILQAFQLLRDCYARGGKVLVMGNGGSCADGAHICGELMKGFFLKRPLDSTKKAALRQLDSILPGAADMLQQGLPAFDLCSHNALITASANDQHPLLTGAQQVITMGNPGDVFIGLSTSGNSKNVLLAAGSARATGLNTLALTGSAGGKLRDISDVTIAVPGKTTAEIQEYHLPVYHALCAMVEAAFFEE